MTSGTIKNQMITNGELKAANIMKADITMVKQAAATKTNATKASAPQRQMLQKILRRMQHLPN